MVERPRVHRPVRIHDTDRDVWWRSVSVPTRRWDARQNREGVDRSGSYETQLRMKERNRKEEAHGITERSKDRVDQAIPAA